MEGTSGKVNVIIIYDGEWKEEANNYIYTGGCTKVVRVARDIGFSEFVDKIYQSLGLDKSLIELKLEVKYVCGSQGVPPAIVANDDDVTSFIEENLTSIQTRTPLCVTGIRRNTVVTPSPTVPTVNMGVRSQGYSFVPETSPTHKTFVEHEPFFNDDPVADLDAEYNNLQNTGMAAEVEYEESNPQQYENKERQKTSTTPGTQNSFYAVPTSRQNTRQSTPSAAEFTAEDIPSSKFVNNSSSVSCGSLALGQIFESKLELKTKTHLYAMKQNFEFVVKKSGTTVWYITCKDAACSWRLRGKKLMRSNMFEITAYSPEHTCSLDLRQKDHRQAAPWVVGHVIKNKFLVNGPNYLPANIRDDMKHNYGIDMSYEKAWRCREKALMYVRGTPEASYCKLPSYLYVLQQKNPGTIHDLVIEDGAFKYCFFSLGVCRRGFRSCRPLLCVDGSFLKTKYGGHMLCAVALDANNHLYPIAFAIVDSENNNSWTYFMTKLKESIGEVDNLVFVSDRHASINHALDVVFPDAHHGACYHHISMNVVAKFKTDHCHQEMFLAAYAFRQSEFHQHFEKLRLKDPAIASYLEGIGFDKWSRAYFPGSRYNVMTSNYAESFNNKAREARTWPITTFVEFIRFTLQTWFCERRETTANCTSRLAPTVEQEMVQLVEQAKYLVVYPLSQFEFHVLDGDGDGEVNLLTKECTCGRFQIMGIPCVHAIAAALQRNVNVYTLCNELYTTDAWRKCYAETIYPCGNEDNWDVPEPIRTLYVRVPVEKAPVGRPKKQGRPKTKRRPSQGEHVVVERKCSRCGGRGHNRATCKSRI